MEIIKDTIVFCASWHETMKKALKGDQYVKVMDALMNYYPCGCVMQESGDPLVDAIAMMCKHTLDDNLQRYINGKKGGRPKTE